MPLGVAAAPADAAADATGASGCTVIADAESGKLLWRQGECDRRITPASTFKIALSLMGYDSGYLTDEHLPALPFHVGYADWVESWKATTDPTSWISNSVVWYSQLLTEWLGEQRFRRYVTAFEYGNADVAGDPGKSNGLTHAWLSSSLQISALEQIAFLRKLVRHRLPVSARAYEMTSRITRFTVLPNGWEVHGKTGSGTPVSTYGSLDQHDGYGWFVGWAVKRHQVLVFARWVQAAHGESSIYGVDVREQFIRELPSLIDAVTAKSFARRSGG